VPLSDDEHRVIPDLTSHAEVDDTGVELVWPAGFHKGWLTVRDADVWVRSGTVGTPGDLASAVVRTEDGVTTGGVTPALDPLKANGRIHPVRKTVDTDTHLAVRCATGLAAEVILEPRGR